MTKTTLAKRRHMCISCANLKKIVRKVKKDKFGGWVGYKFSALCDKKKHVRNPWTALACFYFEENRGQKTLTDYEIMVTHPGVLDSEPAGKQKKRDR